MFDEDSRYAEVETETRRTSEGREVSYKRRRFVPSYDDARFLGRLELGREERLDHASAEALGDPRQYWRLCDANRVMNPKDVDEADSAKLDVPVAGTEGA